MKHSFFTRALSRFIKAEQPKRKNQSSKTTVCTIELLEDRTLLSSTEPFADLLAEVEDVSVDKNTDEYQQLMPSRSADSTLMTYELGINADPNSMVAQKLDELHGMYASDSYIARNYLENYRGYGEKYLTGNNGWYFILPTGEVYQWSASIETSIHIGNLDENYHANPELLYEAQTPAGGPNELLAYQLDQQYNFSASQSIQNKNYYYDLRDNQEKYFQSGNAWYYIVPDGGVYRWYGSIENSQKIAQLDESYHENPMKLIEATNPADGSGTDGIATTDISGKRWLIINPADDYLGTFDYTVLAFDNQKVGTTTKTFTVTNTPPEIESISSHSLTVFNNEGGNDQHNPNAAHVFFAAGTTEEEIERAEAGTEGDYLTIILNALDTDNDDLTYSAEIVNSTAHELGQTYGFYYDAGVEAKHYYENLRGANEKYFKGSNGWFYILPTGDVHRWRGSLAASELVGNVDTGYYRTPEALFNTYAAGDVEATVHTNGNHLIVDPAEDFTGNFAVKVTVSDGYSTDETVVDIFVNEETSNFEFPDSNRWSQTITDGAGLEQGDATTLLWSIVPDGTFIDSFGAGASAGSDLIARMDEIYGDGGGGDDLTQRPWFELYQSVVDRWSEVSGLTYIYMAEDDGADLGSASPGVEGVRADVRIGGRNIDDDFGILAFNFFPDVGDMVIDTGDVFYDDTSGDSIGLRNVVAHEMGHGIGLEHVDPTDGTKLMEAFYSDNYDGPQFDDILAASRGYGDPLEANGGNDTVADATVLGTLVAPVGDDADPSTAYFVQEANFNNNMTIDGNFSDWDSITSYTDPSGDTHDTDTTGRDGEPVFVDHPDVDLLEYKVTHDSENFYFYLRADGQIGNTQTEEEGRAGRYYVIVTIDVDNDDETGYWLDDGGYYPTSNGYDMNAEIEFYDGEFNTGHYLNHGATDIEELEQAFADQSQGGYVFETNEEGEDISEATQGPFAPGFVDILPGSYDYYTQWVYDDNNTPDDTSDDQITFVQDRGPVVLGIMEYELSDDGTEIEFSSPFLGFLTDENGDPIVDLGMTMDFSFSLEASGEFSNEVSDENPNGIWASDTGEPIEDYVLDTGFTDPELPTENSLDYLSIDGITDVDYFQFTSNGLDLFSVYLTPEGEVYQSGPQGGVTTAFDAGAQNDLKLELIGPDGTTVLATSDNTTAGGSEEITDVALAAGTYYVLVSGADDNAQMYSLVFEGISDGGGVDPDPDSSDPYITLSVEQATHADESEGIWTVTADIVGIPNTADTAISLTFSGSATAGIDYEASSFLITIPEGETSGSITITSIDDGLIEATESIIVDIDTVVNGFEFNGFQQITVFIDDNDNIALASYSQEDDSDTTEEQQVSSSPVVAPQTTSTSTGSNEEEEEEDSDSTNTEFASKQETDEETVDEAFALLTEDDDWV